MLITFFTCVTFLWDRCETVNNSKFSQKLTPTLSPPHATHVICIISNSTDHYSCAPPGDCTNRAIHMCNSMPYCKIWGFLLTSLTDVSRADSLIFPSTLKMEAIRSSETSVNTTSIRCHIPEDCFFQPIRCPSVVWDLYCALKNKMMVIMNMKGGRTSQGTGTWCVSHTEDRKSHDGDCV
jgi:hypothetical protein